MSNSAKPALVLLLVLCCLLALTSSQAIYQLENLTRTINGYTGSLILRDKSGPFGGDFKRLKLSLFYETKTRVHLKIVHADSSRWEVPNIVKTSTPPIAPSPLAYAVEFKQYPFTFKLIRLADNEVIFSTEGTSFAYADQYITIGTQLPKDANIYGVGERVHPLRLDTSQTFTIFNKDQGGNPENKNLYGTQPFYMEYRKGKAHGVFFLNSNAMDFKFTNDNPSPSLQFITIGGVIDAYFFMGPTPDDVIRQYQEVVGFPALPPYWGLGFHQCRYGYKSIQETREVVQNYKKNGIPLDTMWNDIDYMDAKKIFTTDPVNYPLVDVQSFVKELHDNNQQYVVIVDPGIKVEQGYKAYDDLMAQKLYVKANDSQSPIYNKVWPGLTIFPDFSDDKTANYWTQLIQQFHDTMVPVDGLWIDMNELGTFCKGDVSGGCWDPDFNEEDDMPTKNRDKQLTAAGPTNPPYTPGGVDLDDHTLRMDAIYKLGIEYNVHNLYGYLESVATRQALEKTRNKRAFIISRSNFAGSGYHVGHWTGDNYSTYRSMRLSIPGIINMNMFGIPLVGSDICGFMQDTTEELCTRWMQLGSFYPFSRNHNALGTISQEPYVFGEQMTAISRSVLLNRYSLLPYYYTLFYHAHTQGSTVMKALFMEYPELWQDDIAGIDSQFMIGRGLMVSPVLDQGVTSVNAYFPVGYWFDYYSGELTNVTQRRYYKQLDAPINVINVHVRGGHIIPKQQPALTTAETRRNPYELLVALNATKMAVGSLFLDDGDSIDTVEQNEFTLVSYSHQGTPTGGVLNGVVLHDGYPVTSSATLDTITVYGIPSGTEKICGVAVNDKQVTSYQFDATIGKMIVSTKALKLSMNNSFKMEWVSKC